LGVAGKPGCDFSATIILVVTSSPPIDAARLM
jgi:hypothetical protein